jgi:beta-phosphoglucomutase
MTSKSPLPAAIIFDVDGVLVDSNAFHLGKWIDFFRAHSIPFDENQIRNTVLGPPSAVIFRHFLGNDLTPEQLAEFSRELEENFRREIGPHARAFPGVQRFIEECHGMGIAMAVASAGVSGNVNFLVAALGLRKYFREVLSVDDITHGKPDPEIYLTTAARLGVTPHDCAVFEDSFVGIEAAKRAGMKCVAVASTFPADALARQSHADLIVPSFESVSLQTLRDLFNADANEAGDDFRTAAN